MNLQCTPRLLWCLENNLELKKAVAAGDALFGTIDSFLLYRLRQGTSTVRDVEHISEITNCTVTGMYDPFTLQFAQWAITMFNIKRDMLPKVVDDSYDFGCVDKSIFGEPLRIVAVMGDQPASLFGNCCFKKGIAKVTLGTGTFLNINTANKCHASVSGLYPTVVWKLRDQPVCYGVEGSSYDTATIVNWGKSIGLYADPAETSAMALSVSNSGNVFFVPAFSGLSAPINDYAAAAGFIGLMPDTNKCHMVRALLESIVFRVAQLLRASMKETDYKLTNLRIDGGVAKNNFICQALADLCDVTIERSADVETTSLGIAYLCAYNLKLSTLDDLEKHYKAEIVFKSRPKMHSEMVKTMQRWEEAVERFKKWY